MEAALEAAWNHANIPVELANLRPHGDMVLVRVLPEAKITGLIWHPDGAKENLSPRIGEVIAVGPGDRWEIWRCCKCGKKFSLSPANRCKGMASAWRCPHCNKGIAASEDDIPRHPMHVKPGDRILYWRTYANEVVINEELYQFLHEEQHVVAVLED